VRGKCLAQRLRSEREWNMFLPFIYVHRQMLARAIDYAHPRLNGPSLGESVGERPAISRFIPRPRASWNSERLFTPPTRSRICNISLDYADHGERVDEDCLPLSWISNGRKKKGKGKKKVAA